MAWIIASTTDGQHIGERIEFLEVGNIMTFPDGDVVAIDKLLFDEDNTTAIVVTPNYQINLIKE